MHWNLWSIYGYIVWDKDPISCFFSSGYLIVPTTFIKMPICSPAKWDVTFICNFSIYTYFFLGFLFCSIGLSVSSCASKALINHKSFLVYSISGRVTPNYCSFLRFSQLLCSFFHKDFGINLPSSKGKNKTKHNLNFKLGLH